MAEKNGLKNKKKIEKLEIKRQLFHLSFGLVIVGLLYFNVLTTLYLFVIIAVGLALSVIYQKYTLPGLSWFIKRYERAKDKKTFPGRGAILFLIGSFIVILLFDKNTALAAITILALGDSISPLVGRFYGRIKHPFSNVKLIEGTIAGIVAGFLGAMLFVSPSQAIIASFVAMTVEAIDIKLLGDKFDDNISIPLVAGFVIWLIQVL